MRGRGVSEWTERGRTGAQGVNGGCLGKRTEGVLRVRERRQRNVGKRKIRRVGGRGREGRGSVSGGSGWEGCGGMSGEIVRDMETDGASRFWETVPKAGRFFCAIVEL